MKNLYTNISLKYLKMQKKRTILTIFGVFLSVALITTIIIFFSSVQRSVLEDTKKSSGDYYVKYQNLPGEFLDDIENNIDVENAAVIEKYGTAFVNRIEDEEKKYDKKAPVFRWINIIAYSDKKFKQTPIKLEKGRLPKNNYEIVLEKSALLYFGDKTKIGDFITLPISKITDIDVGNREFKEDFARKYKIVGIRKTGQTSSTNYVSEGITIFDKSEIAEKKTYDVLIKFHLVKDTKAKSQKIIENLDIKKYTKAYNIEFQEIFNDNLLSLLQESSNKTVNKSLTIIILIVLVLVVLATVAVIYNAFNISILERISQFGILRCIGASPSQIRKIVFREAFLVSLIGIPGGAITGIGVVKILFVIFDKLGRGIFAGILNLYIDYYGLLLSGCIGVISVFLSVIGPARQAGKVSPVAAVKNSGNIKKESIKKSRQLKKRKLTKLLFGIEGQLATKNLKRNRKRYRITVFSMTLSIVLFIVFSGFISLGFNSSVFDETEYGDLYVSNKSQDGENISGKLLDDLKAIKGVKYIFKNMNHLKTEKKSAQRNFTTKVKSEFLNDEAKDLTNIKIKKGFYKFPVRVISYGDDGLKYLEKYLVHGKIDKDRINKENGIVLLNNYKILHDSKYIVTKGFEYDVNNKIELTWENNKDNNIELKISAIVKNGLLEGQYANFFTGYNVKEMVIITSETMYKKITGSDENTELIIKYEDNSNKKKLVAKLTNILDKYPQYKYREYNQASRALNSIAIMYKILLYGFLIVIAVICCLNIINTISTNLILRTRELSIYKAVGMAKRSIKKMIFVEAILYGIIATFIGSLVATGINYLIYSQVAKVFQFGFIVPVKYIAISFIVSISVSIFAGFIPLKRINDRAIMENIRYEE